MDIQNPAAKRGKEFFSVLADRKNQMSSKLAFPQFALLEQNLQISYHVQDSCESQPQHKMPAYSVVKDLCVRIVWTAPLPVGRSLAFFFKRSRNNKKPGVERRAKPSEHTPDGFARCSTICYPEFVTDLSFGWYSETLDRP